MADGALTRRKITTRRRHHEYRPPRQAAIGPVEIQCPSCDVPLGFALRVTLETARQAAKRPQLPEAVVTCTSCRRIWVAGVGLAIAAVAGSEVAS
jgi:hypothetical protein